MEKGKYLGMAAVVTAFLASLCCIGPLIVAGVGVGSALVFATLAAYRPWIIGLTIAALGAASYLAWKKRGRACGDGEACATVSLRRSSWTGLSVVALVAAGLLAVPYLAGRSVPTTGAAIPAGLSRLLLDVDGMTCSACAATARQRVRGLTGVYDAQVDVATRAATVYYQPATVTPGAIMTAIEDAGYQARVHAPDTPHER